MGIGVGIPALDEYGSFSMDGYDPAAYESVQGNASMYSNPTSAYSSKPTSAVSDSGPRENRAASATSHRPKFPQLRENPEPMSPGPPTATLINPNPGRPRAQSAIPPQGPPNELANQWPLERILLWLAANAFSNEWQETFRILRLEKAEFLDLGRSTDIRSNLNRMHQFIYPQLTKLCKQNGIDVEKERKDGKRLQRLIAGILQGESSSSAGVGHRRRESGLTSAGTESTLENSPHLGGTATPSSSGPEGSPAKSQFGPGFGQRSIQERSSTMPVYPKQPSNSTTPNEGRNAESFAPPAGRGDYTRGVLNGIGNRGRHSPNLSGDASVGGLSLRQDGSPGQSPALGHALPSQAQSTPHLPLRDTPKAQTVDSFQKATGFPRNMGSGNIVTTEVPLGAGRFYENQKTENRPEAHRAYSNEVSTKENKGFFSKVFRGKKHDVSDPMFDEPSPTSPRDFMQKMPFTRAQANQSDTALVQRPGSALAEPERSDTLTSTRKVPKRYILVTPDFWNYRLIDVTDVDSAIALKNRIGLELGIVDMEYAKVYLTEPGKFEHEEPLSDAMLAAARSGADSAGNVKFYVRSPSLSAASAPGANSMSMFAQQNRESLGSGPMSREELQRAAEAYREETERKRLAYLQSRQDKRGQHSEAGTPVFDFNHNSPRESSADKKALEELVPLRKPPPAPSASQTLKKVESLRMTSQHRSRGSLDNSKRRSNDLREEPSPRNRSTFDPSGGIGAAIANSSKIAVLPASAGGQKSPRTVTIGNNDDKKPKTRLPTRQDTAGPSPRISAGTDSMRDGNGRRKSYGPDLEFKETNVAFQSSPNPQAAAKDDSDDDSDEGLFAIKIRPKAETPKKDDPRPVLTVVTDQPASGPRKSVAFKTPTSNDTGSAGTNNTGDDSTDPGTSGSYNQRSFSTDSAGWEDRSPEEARARPKSFYSDIWANRPAVENVVEDLDKFFPGVDLDKPFMEDGGEGSPMRADRERDPLDDLKARLGNNITFGTNGLNLDFDKKKSDSDTLGSDESTLKAHQREKVASVASRQMSKAGGLGRMKSIREVAQKRNDVQRAPSIAIRAQQAVQAQQNNALLRRKSTKMFGANIVQIKPQRGNRVSVLDPIPQEEVPNDEMPKRQTTFKIIRGELIGKGTYGRVYLGMNATTGEFLAVKQVEVNQRAAAHDKEKIAEMVKALDIEIDTMQHLEHPNIVQYLGFERQKYAMSIYLEYISGGSVGSCLRKHGKFEEQVVKSMTIQTLRGLKYLHDEGILHRDLKADNILLDLDGTCKISDFGISKKSDDIYRDDVTNSMQGSVFWMAPEVVRTDGPGYSAKVDIWSLGCVVLEMFAGKRPWSREEAIGAIFKLGSLQMAPPIPDDVTATASVVGLGFMYDCFQINPADRPTAQTLLDHSPFCIEDVNYNFYDTELAEKLRKANMMPQA